VSRLVPISPENIFLQDIFENIPRNIPENIPENIAEVRKSQFL